MKKEFTRENIMSFLRAREKHYTKKYNYHFENEDYKKARMCENMKIATHELMLEIEECFE